MTRWYFNSPSTEVISEKSFLVFENVNLKHNGYYYCYGKYHTKKAYFLAKVRLKVYGEFCTNNYGMETHTNKNIFEMNILSSRLCHEI